MKVLSQKEIDNLLTVEEFENRRKALNHQRLQIGEAYQRADAKVSRCYTYENIKRAERLEKQLINLDHQMNTLLDLAEYSGIPL